MKVSKIFIYLSVLAALLTAFASFLGIYSSDTYHLETLNWATQAISQDYVNLFIATPLLIISAYFVNKKSFKWFLVWLGVLLYLIYSYVLYAFCINFGPLFLIYIIILSTSFYSLIGSVISMEDSSYFFKEVKVKTVGIFLLLVAVLFYFLWLQDIFNSLFTKTLSVSLIGTGLIVNPVHILDLAFLLPGMIIVSQLLRQRHLIGLFWAVPILIFLAIMGLAIIVIMFLTVINFYSVLPVVIMMSIIVIFSIILAIKYLKRLEKK